MNIMPIINNTKPKINNVKSWWIGEEKILKDQEVNETWPWPEIKNLSYKIFDEYDDWLFI